MNILGASQAKSQWIALALVLLGLVIGYSIPVLHSPEALAATRSCKNECKGNNCPHKTEKDCSAEECATGVCNCQK